MAFYKVNSSGLGCFSTGLSSVFSFSSILLDSFTLYDSLLSYLSAILWSSESGSSKVIAFLIKSMLDLLFLIYFVSGRWVQDEDFPIISLLSYFFYTLGTEPKLSFYFPFSCPKSFWGEVIFRIEASFVLFCSFYGSFCLRRVEFAFLSYLLW